MRAAIYTRYSTDMQSIKSTEDQIRICLAFAENLGLTVAPDMIFSDSAVSGGSMFNRPALSELMNKAGEGLFEVLVIENCTRLSRRSADTQSIFEELLYLGIKIYPADLGGQPLTSTTAAIHGLVGQLQREATADMVHRGMVGLVRNGRSAGGRCYGYAPGAAKGDLNIIPSEADTIRQIFRWYAQGATAREIAGRLNKCGTPAPRGTRWNASTLNGSRQRHNGILQNELYVGVRLWNRTKMMKNPRNGRRVSRVRAEKDWLRYDDPDLCILDQALWDAVQAMRKSRENIPPPKQQKPKRLFSGLLRCGACGGGMASRGTDRTGKTRIGCSRSAESGDCPEPRTYYLDAIESYVLDRIQAEFADPQFLREYVAEFEAELKRLSATSVDRRGDIQVKLDAVSCKIERLTKLLIEGVGDEGRLDREIKALLPEERTLQAALEGCTDVAPPNIMLHPAALDHHIEAVKQMRMSVKDGSADSSKIIRETLDSIFIYPVDFQGSYRDSPLPRIEIRGKLLSLLEPQVSKLVSGHDGSGGGT